MVVVPRKVRSKDKVVTDLKALAMVLEGLRAQGKTIVFTNGVFDILHVGHVRYLEDARARGDFLVVGVNSDRSAAALKGKGHPIVPLDERMEILSSLWFVDYVTSFDEDTADKVLRTLKPDVYAKGTDYSATTLPEKATVKELGIKTAFVGDKKTHSTSKLLQKIRKRKD
ncbi:MAG TPA: adenylyltransferase/cytidyltransferase family protein [Planctomycetota bacterium]|nr:adenylyltransferase/cytidyltransferase family protein [Planctomycetota bacterium]